jgi:hypothetical protein
MQVKNEDSHAGVPAATTLLPQQIPFKNEDAAAAAPAQAVLPQPQQMQTADNPTGVAVLTACSKDMFKAAFTDLIIQRKFDRILNGMQKFADDADLLTQVMSKLTDWTTFYSSNGDVLAEFKQALDSTAGTVVVDLLRAHTDKPKLQEHGLSILCTFSTNTKSVFPLQNFPLELIVPYCVAALRAMSALPGHEMIDVQRMACKLLYLVCALPEMLRTCPQSESKDAFIDVLLTIEGYDIVLSVLIFLQNIQGNYRQLQTSSVAVKINEKTQISQQHTDIARTYDFFLRWGKKWKCPADKVAIFEDGIDSGIIRIMNSFPNSVSVQMRSCITLTQLAELNMAHFNHKERPYIAAVLNLMQIMPQTHEAEDTACRTLTSFMQDKTTGFCDTAMQKAIGDASAIPLVLCALKRHYDVNNSKCHTVCHVEELVALLVALTDKHPNNCWRLYNAEGVTLLMGIALARRTKPISKIETLLVQALCNVFTQTDGLDIHKQILARAGVTRVCASSNLVNQKRPMISPINLVIATASKKNVPQYLYTLCLSMLVACAELPLNRARIWTPGMFLAVSMYMHGTVRLPTLLLALLTEGGDFTQEQGVRKIADRDPKQVLQVCNPSNLSLAKDNVYQQALARLRQNVNNQPAVAAAQPAECAMDAAPVAGH